jgi:branched-chain amino acid transport system ATP-binding protein
LTEALLDVVDLHVYYGDSHVLHGVSLQVRPGEAVALLGRNGAGKTTTLHGVVGFAPPRAGRVRFAGEEIAGLPPYRIARKGMALVPQGRRIFPRLTVRENLLLGARSGAWDLARVEALFPVLAARAGDGGSQLSGGEQQMLAIGRALLTNPRLLLLDEPSEGLAPVIVEQIRDVLVRLKGDGLSLLLVEQNLQLALDVADRVYVLQKGAVVCEDSAAGFAANEAAKHQFLGI